MAEPEVTLMLPVFSIRSAPSPPAIPAATVTALVLTSDSAVPKIPTVVLSAEVEVAAATSITAALRIVSSPVPPSMPVAVAVAVVPASPPTAPTRPTCTPPATAVAVLESVIDPVFRITSSPAPPLMPVTVATALLSALESP